MIFPTETLICTKTHEVIDLNFWKTIIIEKNKKYEICLSWNVTKYIWIDDIWCNIGQQFVKEFFISEKELRKQKLLKIIENQ